MVKAAFWIQTEILSNRNPRKVNLRVDKKTKANQTKKKTKNTKPKETQQKNNHQKNTQTLKG